MGNGKRVAAALGLGLALGLAACGGEERPAGAGKAERAATTSATGAELPNGLLVAVSRFEKTAAGPKPHSELLFLRRQGGKWQATTHEDPTAPVFHKALVYRPSGGAPGILTLGGSAPKGPAALKLWRKGAGGLQAETVWEANFGGKFSRMRDAELADLDGDGAAEIAVATHDQGVVAVVAPKSGGGFGVTELDRKQDTFVHEIEIGDLDEDGVLEVYATPSEPNRLDGTTQHGEVVRYVPKLGRARQLVADLGERHAKEILVADVDGDGHQELYVSIEAAEGGSLEIRRYAAGADPKGGTTVATLEDPMCRFLVVGDFDGDGKRELVAAAKDSGVWLLRPGADPAKAWQVSLIDGKSKGFEHATLAADLDGDGTDELYVASDDDKEIRRYVGSGGKFQSEVIYRRPGADTLLTWNLTAVPVELMP
jgi:FG-GAP-like repeat